ncbi:hypothetical protein ABIA39_001596 [Nocardia sp. GAS34]|jgi:hypothetical protein
MKGMPMNPWSVIQDLLDQLDGGSSAPVPSGALFAAGTVGGV